MKFDTTLFATRTNIEVGCETRNNTMHKFYGRDDKIRRANMKRQTLFCNAIRRKNCTKTGDTLRRSKDGSQDRERVNAHIEERPYLIERGRCRVPGLNTPPVRLSIRQTHCTE